MLEWIGANYRLTEPNVLLAHWTGGNMKLYPCHALVYTYARPVHYACYTNNGSSKNIWTKCLKCGRMQLTFEQTRLIFFFCSTSSFSGMNKLCWQNGSFRKHTSMMTLDAWINYLLFIPCAGKNTCNLMINPISVNRIYKCRFDNNTEWYDYMLLLSPYAHHWLSRVQMPWHLSWFMIDTTTQYSCAEHLGQGMWLTSAPWCVEYRTENRLCD